MTGVQTCALPICIAFIFLISKDGEYHGFTPYRRYGDSVGVSHVLAGIQPGQKEQTVHSVHNHGAAVAMVGDDSVNGCFRVASVGVMVGAMSSLPNPSHLEDTAADVVLLDGKTSLIPWLFSGARRMNRLI